MMICSGSQQLATRQAPTPAITLLPPQFRQVSCSAQPCISAQASFSPAPVTQAANGGQVQQRRPRPCSAAVTQQATATELLQDLEVSKALACIIQYALDFARASETYEVNSWMLLLGILKYEQSTAAKTLRAMGLDDIYGAWNEVLWALNVCDALEKRPFVPEIGFADRAYKVLIGACRFAQWGGRTKVQSEDLLMALAAGAVLEGLFPDLKMTFPRVRKAVERQAGGKYVLPDDDEGSAKEVSEEDNFL